ncbi:MAG: exodeoxyribonuclease III [Verrucomicrobiota bacterium]
MSLKIISWNVNGIRACQNKGFEFFITDENPDIICLQETKAEQSQVSLSDLDPSYKQWWNSAQRKGYSGTAIFSKIEPLNVTYGLNIEEHDKEGRVITLEFKDYFLTTVYTPNSQNELKRLSYRQTWDRAFLAFLKNLEKSKPVIICGDLNVAHKEIDIARPDANRRNAGFTDEERHGFDQLVAAGFVDTFREFEKGANHYTWWSYRAGARARNIGWRIDYFCVSQALRSKLKEAFILPEILGSDHCPIGIALKTG